MILLRKWMDKTSRSELTVDKKSKEIVYFLEDKTYIYGYRTVKDEFADNEEEMTGVICIGAAILDYTGYPCGAIWMLGPKDRLPKEVMQTSAKAIVQVAKQISKELGYSLTSKMNK